LRVENFFAFWLTIRMHDRIPISSPTERRIRREARSAALRAQALALRQAGATYAEIGAALGLSQARAYQIVRKAERLANSPRWFDPLPMRAQTFLHNAGLTELPETEAALAVAQLTRRELLATPNFGKSAAVAVTAWLARHGFTLKVEGAA
jgi:Homeodomain-like domain